MVPLSFFMGCREYRVSEDSSLRLAFSCDTLTFDTIFTMSGTATAQVMVYNPNKAAVMIDRVWMEDGSAFQVNVDGEPQLSRLTSLQVNGGDSLFVFVRVMMPATATDTPVYISDKLHFHLTNNATQSVVMEAYGQDVIRIGRKGCGRTEKTGPFTFTGKKPYLIFDTLIVSGTLTILPGATIYMHSGACIYALGNVKAQGTLAQPILIRGDRLDKLFEHVPYLYAGGSWNGIYLQAGQKQSYRFEYVDILSGNVGLYCMNTGTNRPTLQMNGCRIHNHTLYGLVLVNTDALVTNTEISNCGSYCVYCSGGKHDFIHTTVASYFGATDVRIQSAAKEETAAVYIDNLSKSESTTTSFANSVITGYRSNQLVVATPFEQYYPGLFIGNYLKTDTLAMPAAQHNTYWQASDTIPVFRNDYFKYKEYVYYDFRLDSLSPAIGIGDSIQTLPYPEAQELLKTDRNGISREGLKPDAGCYQHRL
ncbi:MAG: right-handed parallel beta-helix repeat-containing protein [Paludibacteraceae bacterium]|nr:right-handed parallel beta-helix repeat-containing protein [Paludibacteraceae bacterium]